jgi:hypothetical protein
VRVNFIGDEGEARVREAYPGPTWDRLRAIKCRYDPANLFRLKSEHPIGDLRLKENERFRNSQTAPS